MDETLKKIRNNISANGALSYNIIGDNMLRFNNRSDMIIFDDVNEIMYALKVNTDHHIDVVKYPVEVISTPFSNIQYLHTGVSKEQLGLILNCIKNDGAITDEQIAVINNAVDRIVANMVNGGVGAPMYPKPDTMF